MFTPRGEFLLASLNREQGHVGIYLGRVIDEMNQPGVLLLWQQSTRAGADKFSDVPSQVGSSWE
jgi:hypothetical protein